MELHWRYALLAGVMSLTACGGSEPPTKPETLEPLIPPSEALSKLSGFAGEYRIIDARRASDVSSSMPAPFEAPIGESIQFTRSGIEMKGASCEDWSVAPLDTSPIPILSDPNLVDLILPAADSPDSSGDQQEHAGFVAVCEGEEVFRFHKVDDRVLVMPTANSAINLILERPLSALQLKAYQARLKSMSLYDGDLTGALDTETLAASRAWYIQRAQPGDTEPIPSRPAITENLLDTLDVLAKN